MGRARLPIALEPQQAGFIPEWAAWKLLFMGPTRGALSRMGLRDKPTAELSWEATQKEWEDVRRGMISPVSSAAAPIAERLGGMIDRLPGVQRLNTLFGFPGSRSTPAPIAQPGLPESDPTNPRAELEQLIGKVAGPNFKKGQDLQYVMNAAASMHQDQNPRAAEQYLRAQGASDWAVPALMRLSRESAFSGRPRVQPFEPLGFVEYADAFGALEGLARARAGWQSPADELGGP